MFRGSQSADVVMQQMNLKNSALYSEASLVAMTTCNQFSQVVVQPDFLQTKDSLDTFALGVVKPKNNATIAKHTFLTQKLFSGKICDDSGPFIKGTF